MATCEPSIPILDLCLNDQASMRLKLIAMAILLSISLVVISIPITLSLFLQHSATNGKLLLVFKSFAAGAILSASLVHVLPHSFQALSSCQAISHHPWKDFPFSGLIPMIGISLAFLVHLVASSNANNNKSHYALVETKDVSSSDEEAKKVVNTRFEMGIIGWHDRQEEEMAKLRQRLIKQVLEVGVVFHPLFIGVIMGLSRNTCTIRPLVVALGLHQIFEGLDLGGSMAQAGLSFATTAYICLVFYLTAPIGIVLGIIVYAATGYDIKSSNTLIVEGITCSLASGILLYTAMVKFLGIDFFNNKVMVGSKPWMKKLCYIAFVIGCALMSFLVIWW
ncbi:Zinc/iron permease, partial [Dillenia turbinata]